MSSGERTKPAGEERNPFDISRRSQQEVATEIAKRMAAWKGARGRSAAPSGGAPAGDATSAQAASSARAPAPEAQQPAPSAPVQPPRTPNVAERAERTPVESPAPERTPVATTLAGREMRAPFFASFSVQRAMPPAPSPKQSAAPARIADESRAVPAEPSSSHRPIEPQETPDEVAVPDHAISAAVAAESDAVETHRAEARDAMARWMAAHDVEMLAERPDQADAASEAEETGPALVERRVASAIPPLERLDAMSGRREPTLGRPLGAPDVDATTPAPTTARDEDASIKAAEVTSPIPIEAFDSASGRREPRFDEPPRAAQQADAPPPAAADADEPRAKRPLELPTIETRIEAKRLDTLRADPHMAVHRPVFPHIEPEDWQVPPPTVTRAHRARHGTNWAIGLGAVLLAIGITAPAAILKQGSEEPMSDQDRAALAPALPSQPAVDQPPVAVDQPSVAVQVPQEAADQAAPAAPDLQPPLAVPDAHSQEPQTATVLAPAAKPNADKAEAEDQAASEEQATLGPFATRGELDEAPISRAPQPDAAPQAPTVNLANQDGIQFSTAAGHSSPMIARPFVPDGAPQPQAASPAALSAGAPSASTPSATMSRATVPIDGGSANEAQKTSVGLKPTLIPVLKPKAAAATKAPAMRAQSGKPQQASRQPKPFMPQEFEQMLQSLSDSLNPEGKPPNPALKPLPSSARK